MNWQSCAWRSKSPFEFPDQSGQIVIRHRMRGSALSPATLPGQIRLAIIVGAGLAMSPMRLKENSRLMSLEAWFCCIREVRNEAIAGTLV